GGPRRQRLAPPGDPHPRMSPMPELDRHRRELHVHCYRMLASYEDAEDAVQETYLRAWRHQDGIDDVANVRAWLYRIATNVCLDHLRRRDRTRARHATPAEVPWLQPYPDRLLDELVADADQPDEVTVDRETVELVFLVALQALPARQRATLIARDVLGWSAKDTAALLGTSVAAANSALQRARSTMQEQLPAQRSSWAATAPGEVEQALLDRFIDAHERCDAAAAIAVAAEDILVTMPPAPMRFAGTDRLMELLERAFGPDREGDWRLLPTRANRLPAAGSYLRRPGDTVFRAFKLDVLRVEGDRIAEITTFGWSTFEGLGLPLTLD
ncbi:MAG TPA: RNA polymerase subunit sigma-70, partial [Acidimicrobiales bacterium]|nr:RNA polymerase subunit sigma-70 [Acidimicrobiales bacterium]